VYVGAGVSALCLIALGAWPSAYCNADDAPVALHDAGNDVFSGLGGLVRAFSFVRTDARVDA
jgi:hypothetical protein